MIVMRHMCDMIKGNESDDGDIVFEICDMIKGNESDVGDIVFEILAKKVVFKFLCFILFLALINVS